MIRTTQYRVDAPQLELKARPRGGRKRYVSAEKRRLLYELMKMQREAEKEINAILDSCRTEGYSSWGTERGRAAILRRIYLEKGR